MTTRDEIRKTDQLPRAGRWEHRFVSHGFAVNISGPGLGEWFYFTHLEPALVFGRSARQSCNVSSYGVFRAAEEHADQKTGPSRTILHVCGTGLDRKDDERQHFIAWADACDPHSAHWSSTPRHLIGGTS